MKILLDECIDWRLKHEFYGQHDVKTVQDMGWLGKSNGELLSAASKEDFSIFITIDKKLKFQQNLRKYGLAIVVLDVYRNTLKNLKLLVPRILEQIHAMQSDEVYEIK
ncbi:MAG: DUF5615 family PIN-like protein [Bacteroidetes bacterium]|nr:DUF5615 family PIN-like protein [Bacteroidota bacterium]